MKIIIVKFGSRRDKVTIIIKYLSDLDFCPNWLNKICRPDKYHDILIFTFYSFKFKVISCTQRTLNLIRGSLKPLSLKWLGIQWQI